MNTVIEGLIFAVMVLGVYISYKILDFPDLTVDSSFVLGAAVLSRCLSLNMPLGISMILVFLSGSLAGLLTGIIHTKFNITNLLSGIIVMIGLYSINLRIMGRPNIHLFNYNHFFSGENNLFKIIVVALLLKLALDLLFKTRIGYLVKLVGFNPSLIDSFGLNNKPYKVLGLCISNGLVALSGCLLAQYQGYADINMGAGMLVMGLASIILGEAFMKYIPKGSLTTAAILGGITYRVILSLTIRAGLDPSDLKLITAIILFSILVLNNKGSNVMNLFERRKSNVEIS